MASGQPDTVKTSLARKLQESLGSPSFNKRITWARVLARAAETTMPRLPIPETIVTLGEGQCVFLYTDQEGVLRMRSGERCESRSAGNFFAYATGVERQKLKNQNPRGIHIPKFVLFSENGVDTILTKKSALSLSSQPAHRVIQRYVVPMDFTAQKTIVHWSRSMPMHVFTVTRRTPIDSKSPDSSAPFNTSTVASCRYLDNCEVKREERAKIAVETLADTVRSIVEKFGLDAEEQLEELVFTFMTALSGTVYVLNCKRARVGSRPSRGAVLSRRASMLRPEDLRAHRPSLLTHPRDGTQFSYLPPTTLQIPAPVIRRSSFSSSSDPVTSFAFNHISATADTMDKTMEQARERKQEAALLMQRVKLLGYPPWFLSQCISRAYDDITADPRFLRYFGGKKKVSDHLKESLLQVFSEGSVESRIRAIHRGMNITEEDFCQYVKIFESSLASTGASEADVQKARTYLLSFKSSVTGKKEEEHA